MNTVENDDKEGAWRGWFRRKRSQRVSAGERALITAQGKALAVLATTLHSHGHLDGRRYADMLALFGTVVSEEDKLQGAILALWGEMMEESLDLAGAAVA